MRALVTGGAGYIGAAVATLLLEEGHEVVVVDDLSTGDPAAVPDGAVLQRCSVADGHALGEVLDDAPVDVCLHFAGRIVAPESMHEPEAYFVANVAHTLSLLSTLHDHRVGRFVFSSSAAVYGEPRSTPLDEDHPTDPVNAYGESKLLAERALGWLARLGRIRFAALRYFNAAGAVGGRPERHRPETHLIPIALEAASGARDHLDLFGDDYPTRDGTCVRDYVHVADLARAHVLAVAALERHAVVVCNLGTGTGSTNAEVVRAVREVTGREVPVRVAPRREGDPAALVAGNALARELLGWSPTRTLQEMVADAWAALGGVAQRT